MSYSKQIDIIFQILQNNNNDISALKNNHLLNEIITTDDNQTTIFQYDYTQYKILNIDYNIIGYNNDDIIMYKGVVLLKNLQNTVIVPDFCKSYYKDENLKDCDIIITIQEKYICIKISGILNKTIQWKSNISLLII